MKYIMSDGRTFTEYQSSGLYHFELQKKYLPGSTQVDFKNFLQNNADKLQADFAKADGTGCALCPVCASAVQWKGQPLKQ